MRSTMRAGMATVAVLAVLSTAGCASSGGNKAAATTTTTAAGGSTTTTTAGSSTTTDATTTTTAGGSTTTTLSNEGTNTDTSSLDTLPDGFHYGYMAGIENGKVEGTPVQVILFDKVDFLTGQAAVDAAHADGAIPASQDFVENDYYIRNQNQLVRRLAVVPDASITTLAGNGGSPDHLPSSVDEVAKQPYLFKILVGNVRGITTISSIEAVFLP